MYLQIQKNLYFSGDIQSMKVLERKELKYALGVLGLGALLFGLFKAYRHYRSKPPKRPPVDQETRSEAKVSQTSEDDNLQHTPYEQLIEDLNNWDLDSGEVVSMKHLKDIQYRIILCLMKGNSYQGIVNIGFHLQHIGQEDFPLTFHGNGIKFMKVNGRKLEAKQFKYSCHRLLIPTNFLKQKSKNTIEVIFENNYSFVGNGLGSYFVIDENHKYSLRQQVIYSIGGWNQIPNTLPCINCSNECTVQVQVIHPENFEVFSNSTKSLARNCSVAEYHKYPFLFDHSSNPVNRSIKLNSSTVSAASAASDNFSSCSYYSSSAYYGRRRANTHFHPAHLPSVHHLFLFGSQMAELQPANTSAEPEILLRYFCKYPQSHLLAQPVSQISHYLQEVFRRLADQHPKLKLAKLDVFIINDPEADGHFAPGALILHEQTVQDVETDSRCYYLIARAITGILRLANAQNTLRINDILELNQQVFARFEQLRSYIYLKNQKYTRIRQIINDSSMHDYITKNEAHFLQYYSHEMKYLLRENISDKVSFQLNNVLTSVNKQAPQQFWEHMLSNYNFLSQLIIDPLVKHGLSTIGPPIHNPKLLEQLRMCFNSSKYALSFYSDKEISDNLPKFVQCEAYGLEDRLPTIRVLQKFKDFITERYHNYLPVKSNTTEAEIFYNQFKKFNEKKNFHHITTLKNEVKRVKIFGKDFITPSRVPINCSFPAWKLFRLIKIFPADSQRYNLLKSIDNIQDL